MTGFGKREDRIHGPDGEIYCDKATHMSPPNAGPVLATCVLTCADCGKIYARCAACNRYPGSAANSMRAHRAAAHRRNHALERAVLPPAFWKGHV